MRAPSSTEQHGRDVRAGQQPGERDVGGGSIVFGGDGGDLVDDPPRPFELAGAVDVGGVDERASGIDERVELTVGDVLVGLDTESRCAGLRHAFLRRASFT